MMAKLSHAYMKYLLALVAMISKGEGEPIELEAIQNPISFAGKD